MPMQFRVVRLSGWRAAVAVLAGLLGLAAVIALLAVSFVFVVLPTLVIGALAWGFRPRRPLGSAGPVPGAKVIEGTYQVTPDDGAPKRLDP